jgi:translation initiation factor 2 subunit 2
MALERIVQLLKENNPSLATQTNIQLEKPQIERLGTKKSLWKNFEAICT